MVKIMFAFALLGLTQLATAADASSGCDRDEVVMFQLPETKIDLHARTLVEGGSLSQPSGDAVNKERSHSRHLPGETFGFTSYLFGYGIHHLFVHRLLAGVLIGFLVW